MCYLHLKNENKRTNGGGINLVIFYHFKSIQGQEIELMLRRNLNKELKKYQELDRKYFLLSF